MGKVYNTITPPHGPFAGHKPAATGQKPMIPRIKICLKGLLPPLKQTQKDVCKKLPNVNDKENHLAVSTEIDLRLERHRTMVSDDDFDIAVPMPTM